MDKNSQDFTVLHNRLYGKVFSFVRLRIKDADEAKDIVQDVFLKAYNSWNNRPEEMPDENTARNFLYVMARQRMIDFWRSSRFKTRTELLNNNTDDTDLWESGDFDSLESTEPLPEDVFEQTENKALILELLNKLKKEDREILILRFLDELEYRELARIYKTGEDNVRQKVSRSLQKLKVVAQDKAAKSL